MQDSSALRRWRRRVVALAAGLLAVWASGVRLFEFPGESMAPAVMPGDHFVGLVGLWSLRVPTRFEMVIFDPPPPSPWAAKGIPWMKRVVGLPGETVRLSGDQLFIDGQRLENPHLHLEASPSPATELTVRLKADEYFVVGDNLSRSFDDSRSFGPLRRDRIRGTLAGVLHR